MMKKNKHDSVLVDVVESSNVDWSSVTNEEGLRLGILFGELRELETKAKASNNVRNEAMLNFVVITLMLLFKTSILFPLVWLAFVLCRDVVNSMMLSSIVKMQVDTVSENIDDVAKKHPLK
jgi:hypothetical protein